MVITPETLPKHELIGLTLEVVQSTDPGEIGIKGQIIGETKNTLEIQTSENVKMVQKKGTVFRIMLNGKKVDIDGDILLKSPEERTKTLVKKW